MLEARGTSRKERPTTTQYEVVRRCMLGCNLIENSSLRRDECWSKTECWPLDKMRGMKRQGDEDQAMLAGKGKEQAKESRRMQRKGTCILH